MIRSCYDESENQRIIILPLADNLYDDEDWVRSVTNLVSKQISNHDCSVVLVGHRKDETSYYLSMFPKWRHELVPNYKMINATDIRGMFFKVRPAISKLREVLAKPVFTILQKMRKMPFYDGLLEEQLYNNYYKRIWDKAPFTPILVTVDSLVIYGSKLLMIRRKCPPGKGTLALPGGFLEPQEYLLDSSIRELKEETNLAMTYETIKDTLVNHRVFDDPSRSTLGRAITHLFTFIIAEDKYPLPEVSGGDDAEQAFWVELDNINSQHTFEDHYDMIKITMKCLGQLPEKN
jgi:bifunctional NMN adenylyltransferase/nudix hydrolase